MWYLNYCAPFLNTDSLVNTVRYALIGEVMALFVVFILLRVYYLCSTPKLVGADTTSQQLAGQQEGLALSRMAFEGKPRKQYSMFGKVPSKLWQNVPSSRDFKRSYTMLFGHHAVSVVSCLLYSPFIPQLIMAVSYFLLMALLLLFVLLQYRKWIITIYVFMMIVNLSLLFSAVLGAGASKFNELKMECNLDQSL